MSEFPPPTPAVSRKELEGQVEQDAKEFAESQKIGIDLGSEWAESASERMKKLSKLVGEVEDLNKPYYQNLSGLEDGDGFEVPEGRVQDSDSTAQRFEATRESSKADNPRAYMLAERANAAEERTALLEATRKHAQAYGEFHKKHNIVSRLFKRAQVATGLGHPEDAGRLAALKHQEEQAQIAYAQKLETSVIARLTAEGKDQEYIDKVRARYNRLIQFHEVIKPADDAKKASRIEALNTKEKDVLEKGMGWFGSLNNKLEQKLGKNGARAVRLIATSALATAGVVTLSSFGLVAGVAVGSYAGWKLLKGAVGLTGGVALGGAAGKLYEKKRTGVNEEQSKIARSGSITSKKDIQKQAAAYDRGTAEGMAKRRMFLESVVAGLVGAGLSYEVAANIASIEAVTDAIKATALDASEYLKNIPGIPDVLGNSDAIAPGMPLPLGVDTPVDQAPKSIPPVAEKTVISPTETQPLTRPDSHDPAPAEKIAPVPAQPVESVPPPVETPKVVQPEMVAEPEATSKVAVAPEAAPVSDTLPETVSVETELPPALPVEEPVDPAADAAARAALEPSSSYEGTVSDAGEVPSLDSESVTPVPSGDLPESIPVSQSANDFGEGVSPDSPTMGVQEAVSQLTQPSVEMPETSSIPAPSTETIATDAPVTLGVKEAIAQFNAPQSTEVPDTAPSIDTPFTNNFGVPVNPQLIGAYTWQVPGTDLKLPMTFGGSPSGYSDWALNEVLKNPTETRLFVTQVPDPLTGTITPRVDSWSIDATGKPELTKGVVNPVTGRPLPPINPQDFIRRLP